MTAVEEPAGATAPGMSGDDCNTTHSKGNNAVAREQRNRQKRKRYAANKKMMLSQLEHHVFDGDKTAGWGKINRSLPAAITQLSEMRDTLKMTDACSAYAAYLFHRLLASNFMSGRVLSHCVAAAVLLACRKYGTATTISDVAAAAGMDKLTLGRTYRKLYGVVGADLPIPNPAPFITKIGEEAGVSEAAKLGAHAILASLDSQEIAGKDPNGLAAGVLYLSCVQRGEMVLRRDIAEAAGVSETTISSRYNDLAAVIAVR